MGKLLSKIFGNKEMRILMLGLDAAGKTSESMEFDTRASGGK
jgi:GTPase SAR1 family protein